MKHYYKVTPGPTFDILDGLLLQLNTARRAVIDWKNRHELPTTRVSYKDVWFQEGFTPEKAVWKKGRKKGSFTPRATSAEGKRLLQELNNLPKPVGWFEVALAFSEAFGKDVMMVNSKGAIGFARVKEEPAFYMNCDPYWLPDDQTGLVEVTASEFEAHTQP